MKILEAITHLPWKNWTYSEELVLPGFRTEMLYNCGGMVLRIPSFYYYSHP
jgi:hypothetical protein